MLIIKYGNLLDFDAQYIAHQCNCRSTNSAGLAKQIFDKYPYSNVYSKKREFRKMGDIYIANGEKNIINIFAQYYPGKFRDSGVDTYKKRIEAFISCLRKILEIKNIKSIAFPYNIGCGLAGGKWNDYKKILENFAKKANEKNISVYLVRYSSDDEVCERKFFTGIGHRKIPKEIDLLIGKISYKFSKNGWTLRSGGAPGCDMAFERGIIESGGKSEIYLPYANFGREWREPQETDIQNPTKDAIRLAKELAEKFKDYKKVPEDNAYWKFLARNMHQILGKDLETPSQKVVCYTEGGKDIGGTRWALRLAREYGIEIINLGNPEVLDKYNNWIQ